MRVALTAFLLLAVVGLADEIWFGGTYRETAVYQAKYQGQAFADKMNHLIRLSP